MAKACGRRHNLDGGKTLQGLLPDNPQLHFSQTIAHTTVNTEPEGRMIAHAGSIDQETICIGDHQFVSIGGALPQDHLVTRLHPMTFKVGILCHGSPHVRQWRLKTDNFRDHGWDKTPVSLYTLKLLWKIVEK